MNEPTPRTPAMQDVIEDEGERWDLISRCDVNQYWSSLIGVFRGELRAWFCEIAGAQAMLHQHQSDYPDTGIKPVPGWWRFGYKAFEDQVKFHCHQCGIPLRSYGELAVTGQIEQVSKTHETIYKPKVKGREVQVVELRTELVGPPLQKATDYIQNGSL